MEWLAGETEVLGGNLPRRHFVHHKCHLTRSQWWEASNYLLKLWRGLIINDMDDSTSVSFTADWCPSWWPGILDRSPSGLRRRPSSIWCLSSSPSLHCILALYVVLTIIYPAWRLDSFKQKETAQYTFIACADISSRSHLFLKLLYGHIDVN
jgi:hypothetical protein